MLKVRTDERAVFASEMLLSMAGGADLYTADTQALVLNECLRNEEIKTLAGMYLVGSSERAEHNLSRLRAKLVEVFTKEIGK
jgi:hypothetical protein